ncbi:ribonuclease p subunit p30 [Anaeramoeba ignava]|uniref:Ribonuclease p subunit p30 n=1 Tax=Anaeramoeba ignava TaxID=1746090 RepID=A0A9Q0LUE0_ANAIG|nr:ribonuclease p subunit p30 [Anaeramoeba ignava]
MFCDLYLKYNPKNKKQMEKLIAMAIKLNYDCVAFNQNFTGKITEKSTFEPIILNEKKDQENSTKKISTLRLISDGKKGFKQLSRMTYIPSSNNDFVYLNRSSQILETFDIVAIEPKTKVFFDKCCEISYIDIITFDLNEKIDFQLSYKQIKQAIRNGIFFEIRYSSLLGETQIRRKAMNNILNIIKYTKGKNIIFSSGTSSLMELRGPYDIMNLGTLFDLPFEKGKLSISKNCESAISHGYLRKTFNGIVEQKNIEEIDEKEKWELGEQNLNLNQNSNQNSNQNTNQNENMEIEKQK